MTKFKKISALLGVVLLAGLYISTLVFALIGHSVALKLLNVSIAATIFVPIMLYVCMMFYKMSKKDDSDSPDNRG